MDIDFSLVLLCLVAFCGALWLLDSLLIKKTRDAAIEEYKTRNAKNQNGGWLNGNTNKPH